MNMVELEQFSTVPVVNLKVLNPFLEGLDTIDPGLVKTILSEESRERACSLR